MPVEFKTIVLPTRPQPDTLVAIFILKTYGIEKFHGIDKAVVAIWQEMPSGGTEEELEKKGVLLLDFGSGKLDHHNKEPKTTASNLVVELLGLQNEASLAKLLEYAKRDDFYGKGTMSADPIDRALGLSGLIASLNKCMPSNPEQIPDYIIPLLWAHHQEELRRTEEMPREFETAIKSGKAEVFNVKQRDKNLRVVIISSDNASLAGFLRSQIGGRHDVVAQQLSSGHTNILTRPTKHVDLRSLIAIIRLTELGMAERDSQTMYNFSKTGKMEEVQEWYYDPATNSLLNGGLNPKETLATKIPLTHFRKTLEDGLSEKLWNPIRHY
ncbi:MAG: hypothetical protein HZA94_02660 [Candidatus Vogelbacteria bacterium]|nr:hypothetical protein [Candidatus Vogelbacteria bacterium]